MPNAKKPSREAGNKHLSTPTDPKLLRFLVKLLAKQGPLNVREIREALKKRRLPWRNVNYILHGNTSRFFLSNEGEKPRKWQTKATT